MSLPKYPEYKDSGVAWLGEVPVHWELLRLKVKLGLLTERAENRNFPVALENIESWSGRFVATDGEFEGDGVAFCSGDILFGKLRPYLAKVYLADCDGEAVGDFHVLHPTSEMNGDFVQRQILNKSFIDVIDGTTFGSKMPRASWESLSNMPLLVPPLSEQTAIAAFLAHETGKIDALIAEQEQLIALLAEKRQATISHAVTKGLNPDALMKDSGLAWLGEVPGHWERKRVKHVKAPIPNAFVDGPFGSNLKSQHFIDGGDVYVIESNFATQNRIEPTALKTISFSHFESVSRSEVKAGDIVIAKIGAQFGKASILPLLDKRSLVSGNSLKLTVNNDICETSWIHLQLINLKNCGEIDLLSNGSAQPALSLGDMNNLPILVPPMVEQQAILSFLDTEIAKLDALKDESEHAIALLKERRSALIAAAVSGKIDVCATVTELEAV